jgi:RNA polymerase sigma factor (sigma-70 family)
MANAEALFVAHRESLFRYLCRAVGQTDTARDLTQEVFLRVARAPSPSGGHDQSRAWLFSIARNLALDHHRRQRQLRGQVHVGADVRPASQDAGVMVRQALAALPDLDRDLFLMREVGGLSYDELAKACELSPDAVRSRLHRARLALREWLSAPIAARRLLPMKQHRNQP